MPSTYTANKIYELQQTGENTGTWGALLNAVLSILDLNLGGRLALNVAGAADVTLTTTQERNAYILMTGILTGSINLVFTATNGGFYLIDNRSTGSFTITAKPSGGTGVVIPQNAKCLVMVDPDNTRCVIIGTPNMLTTQGDIIYRDANGAQRLAAGTAGYLLSTGGAGANPSWVVPSGSSLLASGTVSVAAVLDLVLTSYTAYRALRILLTSWIPATDGANLQMRFSTDGGSNFDSGGTDYAYAFDATLSTSAVATVSVSNGFSSIVLGGGVGNGANEGCDADITLTNQASNALWTKALIDMSFVDNSATPALGSRNGSGVRRAAQDTNAIRLFFAAGNITSGNYAIYGIA